MEEDRERYLQAERAYEEAVRPTRLAFEQAVVAGMDRRRKALERANDAFDRFVQPAKDAHEAAMKEAGRAYAIAIASEEEEITA